jgi:leader peptidase (prepilin peptidase)/N-methyltransferase
MSLPLETMEALAIGFVFVWLFCLGATVGSFLNVVVWRLPRGLSLVHPGSLCPVCRHPIRLRDNIPLLSWLALRGRCRDCQAPIPLRYLLVELATGTTFLALAVARTLGPAADPRSLDPRWLLSWELAGRFWIDYLRDVLLLSSLFAAALIEADGFVVPWRLWWPATLVALLGPYIGWFLGPSAILGGGPGARERLAGPWHMPLWQPWVNLVLGLAVGEGLERVRRIAASRNMPARPLAPALGVTAANAGWPAMVHAACGGMVLRCVGRMVGLDIPAGAAVGGVVAVELLGADMLVEMVAPWIGRGSVGGAAMAAICAMLALAAAGLLGRLERSCLPPAAEPPSAPSPPTVAASAASPHEQPP